MNIEITARHVNANDEIKEHVRERMERALRAVDDVTSVHVILDHERARSTVECVVHGRNLSAAVHADGEDFFAAADRCGDKLRHQLDHHLGRRRDKRRRAPGLAQVEAELAAAELAAATEEDTEEAVLAPPAPRDGILRIGIESLDRLSLVEARERLEDDDARPFLVFRDATSQALCVLWRTDGDRLALTEIGAA